MKSFQFNTIFVKLNLAIAFIFAIGMIDALKEQIVLKIKVSNFKRCCISKAIPCIETCEVCYIYITV